MHPVHVARTRDAPTLGAPGAGAVGIREDRTRVVEDLGPWSRPQARAIGEVLREAGLDPRLEPDGDRVRVSVPDDQAGAAHRALAAQMGRVAGAAGSGRSGDGQDGENGEAPLVLERLRSWGGWLAVLVVVMFVALEIPGPLRLPAALLALAAVLAARWWWGRDRDGRGPYGPGA